jgi:hypothetical protein
MTSIRFITASNKAIYFDFIVVGKNYEAALFAFCEARPKTGRETTGENDAESIGTYSYRTEDIKELDEKDFKNMKLRSPDRVFGCDIYIFAFGSNSIPLSYDSCDWLEDEDIESEANC